MTNPQGEADTPVRLEVWERGAGIEGAARWAMKEAYEVESATKARRAAKDLYREAREAFRFPAYLVRHISNGKALWVTMESTSWQPPSWVEVPTLLCSASAHAKLFFRPALPGVGAMVVPKRSEAAGIVIGCTGKQLETLHILFEDKNVIEISGEQFWKSYRYVRGVFLPLTLRFADYEGPTLFQELLASGSLNELYGLAEYAIKHDEVLERGAGGFISPSRLPQQKQRIAAKASGQTATKPKKKRRKGQKAPAPSQKPSNEGKPE